NGTIENNSNCSVGSEHWLVSSCAEIEDGKSTMTKDRSIPGTDAFVVRPSPREDSGHLLHRRHVRSGVFQTNYASDATHSSGSFLVTMVRRRRITRSDLPYSQCSVAACPGSAPTLSGLSAVSSAMVDLLLDVARREF